MFWGLILKANRKYSQTTSKSFHISQAALDPTSSQGGATQVFLTYEEQKFLICTLHKDRCEQVSLDLNFSEGDEISFQSQGSGNVTLSGYLIDQDPMSFMGDDSGEEEESDVEAGELEDARDVLDKKAKKKGEKLGKAAVASTAAEEDDDEDDSDFNVEGALDGEVEEGDEEDDDDDDDDDDEEDDEDDDNDDQEDAESEDEEVQQPKAKQPKLEKSHKQQNGVAKDAVEQKTKKDKKNKKENKDQKQQQQQQKQGGEKVLSGGVKIEDIRVGSGPEAKSGKRTTVYYEGRLKSNNKVFDSLKQGAGFKFALGRSEVIKGWDIGVAGMKVGGKRRITCPPHMAYGARGSPPTIPPNSTLVFEVELKGVN